MNTLMEDFTSERRLVWLALTDFYRDTPLQAADLAYIHHLFAQSGFSQAEIKRINYAEVAPVLIDNLRSGTGVWDGFDKAWVIDQIVDRLTRPRANQAWGPVWWLWCRQVDHYTNRYFDLVFNSD